MQSYSSSSLSIPSELAQSRTGKVVIVVSATLLLAASAHVSIPLPFTPVPLTLQTLAVVLIGIALGPALGASAMVLYLAEGAAGMPVFSPQGPGGLAQLLGPTAGYLLSYPLAAAVAGWAVRAIRPRGVAAIAAYLSAAVLFFSAGAIWLGRMGHLSPLGAWSLGVAPFLPGEALKTAAAVGIVSAVSRWHRTEN